MLKNDTSVLDLDILEGVESSIKMIGTFLRYGVFL